MSRAARVEDIMNRRPVTVGVDTTIAAAVRQLARHHVTSLPVVDHRDRAVGVVSEADLLGPVADGRVVGDVMTSRIVGVTPDTALDELGRILSAHLLKSLPVMDASGRVVGVVSRSDVVEVWGRDDEQLEDDVVDALVAAGFPRCRVHSRNGVVALVLGSAHDEGDVSRVADLVAAVPGVRAVHVS